MSEIAAEMKDAITILGGERLWSDTRARWLERAARAAGISYRGAYALFYQQGHEPRACTVEKVRRAIKAREQGEANARAEYRDITERLKLLERRLASIDPDFYCSDIEAIGAASHSARPQTD
jgi:hypothetical protein